AEAEHRHAERLEQLGGRRHVQERLHPGRDDEHGTLGERVQVGGDVGWRGPSAVHAAEPARRQHLDPGGPAHRERRADGRRADRALHRRRGEVARADLAGGRVEAGELGLRQADDDLLVEHADRRGHRARLAHRALGGEPDRGALPRREPVRDQRRLERHDGAGLADLVRDPDHGIAPIRAQQRAAASRPSSGPPTRKPAAKASPAPVVSTTSVGTAASRRPSTSTPRAPRFTTHAASSRPNASRSRAPAKTSSGASARTRARKAPSIAVHAERSTDTRAPCERASSAARADAPARGSRWSAYPETCSTSQSNHDGSSSPASSSGAEPRSDAIVRSPAAAIETTTPVRPEAGPRTSTPRARSSPAASSPAASAPRLPTKRAAPPSAATQAATFAAWPPAQSREAAGVSSPGTSGRSTRTTTSSRRSPSVVTRTVRWSHGRAEPPGETALLRPRRPRRGRGDDRDRPPPAPPGAAPALRARGARRVRGRAVLPRARRARGAELPRGRRDRRRPERVVVVHEVRPRDHRQRGRPAGRVESQPEPGGERRVVEAERAR